MKREKKKVVTKVVSNGCSNITTHIVSFRFWFEFFEKRFWFDV